MSKITCFISFSHEKENMNKFKEINQLVNKSPNLINYSERKDKSNFSKETIWEYLHDRIAGSSCTILLYTEDLSNNRRDKIEYIPKNFLESGWVYNEISASLRDRKDNKINGLVCVLCDGIKLVPIDQGKPLPRILTAGQNFDYIVWVSYEDFVKEPTKYINKALKKRDEQMKQNKYYIKHDPHNE